MMDRRRFLGVVTKTVAGGLLAGDALAAPVQGVTPLRSKNGGGEAPGVAGREIRIGMSAAFKGTAGGLGTEFYRGAQAVYFTRVQNERWVPVVDWNSAVAA